MSAKTSNCETCKFWKKFPHKTTFQLSDQTEEVQLGHCRFNPPSFDSDRRANTFPVTEFSDWCGQHQSRNRESTGPK